MGRVASTAIACIATSDSIAAWIQRARARTVRELLEEIRAASAAGQRTPLATEFEGGRDTEGACRREITGTSDSCQAERAEVAHASRRTLDEPEPEIADTVDVRLMAPRAVASAFEEVFDLHRAVTGYEASVASFTLGFASCGHYAVERLGMARRTAESCAGIVRTLRRLPVVRRAYESGCIGLEKAWILHRILAPHRCGRDLEVQWVEHARVTSVRRLRDQQRAGRLRDLEPPADAAAAGSGDDRGTAVDRTRDEPPLPMTDAEWSASLYRAPGTCRSRLRNLRLPGICDPEAPATCASCADVCIRLRLPSDIAPSFVAAVESARRQAVAKAETDVGDEPRDAGTPTSVCAARAYLQRGRPVAAWVGLLALLEDYVETWDDPASFPERGHRQLETYSRAGWRCQAPGCTRRRNLEDHHVVYRAHQGGDALSNQLCLCRFHHKQGEHGELLRCRGQAPLGVLWRLGKSELASWYRNDRRVDVDRNESNRAREAEPR